MPAVSSPDENTPLLRNQGSSLFVPEPNVQDLKRHKGRILLFVWLLVVAVDVGGYLAVAPQTKIFEDIICEQYYRAGKGAEGFLKSQPSNEERCKVEPVQSELAIINGWKDTFDQLPSIMFALPWGMLADRAGRKPVALLGILGCVLGEIWIRVVLNYLILTAMGWWPNIFPLRLVWLSSCWQLIGGGTQMIISMLLVILSDVFSEEERATAFFRMTSASLLSEIVATPLSAAMMSKSSWIPFLLGCGIMALGGMLMLFIPETLKVKEVALPNDDPMQEPEGDTAQDPRGTLAELIRGHLQGASKAVQFISTNIDITLVLTVFFVSSLGRQATTLLLLYVSKRYNWSIARASFLMSLRGSINLGLLLVIMPFLSSLLLKRFHFSGALKDLRLAQGSCLLLIGGALIMSLAASPPILITGLTIFALGAAFPVTARSLIATLVQPNHVATMFTAAAVVTSIGMLVAGPLLAATFKWGMLLGEAWLGLPFLVTSMLYLFDFVLISCVNLERGSAVRLNDDDES